MTERPAGDTPAAPLSVTMKHRLTDTMPAGDTRPRTAAFPKEKARVAARNALLQRIFDVLLNHNKLVDNLSTTQHIVDSDCFPIPHVAVIGMSTSSTI